MMSNESATSPKSSKTASPINAREPSPTRWITGKTVLDPMGATDVPPADYQTGYIGAQFSSLAYATSAAAIDEGLKDVDGGGWAPATYKDITSTNTQAFFTRRQDAVSGRWTIVLAFRGSEWFSETSDDWWNNLLAALPSTTVINEKFAPGGLGPSSWVRCFASIESDVQAYVTDSIKAVGGMGNVEQIFVTGHSLGAVLALYCLANLWDDFTADNTIRPGLLQLFTYAMPPAADGVFRGNFNCKLVYGEFSSTSFVSLGDPVTNPALLATVFRGYAPVPVQQLIFFSETLSTPDSYWANHLMENYLDVLDGLRRALPAVGPWGGTGGDAFDDRGLLASPLNFIRSIGVRSGSRIDAIQVDYDRNQSTRHGGDGGDLHTFNIPRNDHLKEIQGTYGVHDGKTVVYSLTFKTDGGVEKTYGKPGKTAFSVVAPAGVAIQAFFGRSGNALDAIGVVFAPLPLLNFSVEQGGDGGSESFSDSVILTQFSTVTSVTGVVEVIDEAEREVVNGIGFTFSDTGTTEMHVGSRGGKKKRVDLASGDVITGVRGWLANWASPSHSTVIYLEFHTQMGNTFSFGNWNGPWAPAIVFDAEEGCAIIGLTGKTGSSLDSLGFITRTLVSIEDLHTPGVASP